MTTPSFDGRGSVKSEDCNVVVKLVLYIRFTLFVASQTYVRFKVYHLIS